MSSPTPGQYLSFRLDQESFALDITQVREVGDYVHVTKVPRTPDFLCGVMNLRGNVVPVVDLRISLGMEPLLDRSNACVIIVEAKLDDEEFLIGALADSVNEVIELSADQINPAPKIGMRLQADYLRGMARVGDEFILLLEMEHLLSRKELEFAKFAHDDELGGHERH